MSDKLEQFKFKLEKIIRIQKYAGKVRNEIFKLNKEGICVKFFIPIVSVRKMSGFFKGLISMYYVCIVILAQLPNDRPSFLRDN